jgi:hypothetical protein
MCENLVDIGNENAPPTAHQPSATTGVSSSAYLYGQQPQAAQWVMDFAQNVNDMNMIRVFFSFYKKLQGLTKLSHFFFGGNFLNSGK